MRNIVLACLVLVAACGRDDSDIDSLVGNDCVGDRECAVATSMSASTTDGYENLIVR